MTTTIDRSPRPRAAVTGFGPVLHAEWTKFRTVPGWVGGLLAGAALIVALGLATGMSGNCGNDCGATLGPGGEPVTDSYYFVHRPLAGNGTLTVRVAALAGTIPAANGPGQVPGLAPWAKAGLIITGTRPGAAYAAVMLTGHHGPRMQYDYAGDLAGPVKGAGNAGPPRWLRLTRSGDTFTGYQSADGTTWQRIGAVRLAGVPRTAQAGLFVASPQWVQATDASGAGTSGAPTQATAVFDQLAVRGGRSPGGWAGAQVGGNPDGPNMPPDGVRKAGGRLTVTGSGDIAPSVAGGAGFGVTITQTLVGTFAGLIAVVVVAGLFMTAEYRRGLIRVTLAASPRRGRVLAAKAAVIAAVAFVTGLAAAAVVVTVGQRELRADGVGVYPVTWLTELRVIAGTGVVLAGAALLALGLGALLRRSAGAVSAAIVLVVLPYILAFGVLPQGAGAWLLRVTPAAAFAVQQTLPQYPQVSDVYVSSAGYFPLSAWAGLAVLGGWAALALGLAALALRRRDA